LSGTKCTPPQAFEDEKKRKRELNNIDTANKRGKYEDKDKEEERISVFSRLGKPKNNMLNPQNNKIQSKFTRARTWKNKFTPTFDKHTPDVHTTETLVQTRYNSPTGETNQFFTPIVTRYTPPMTQTNLCQTVSPLVNYGMHSSWVNSNQGINTNMAFMVNNPEIKQNKEDKEIIDTTTDSVYDGALVIDDQESTCDSIMDPIQKVKEWKKMNKPGLVESVRRKISHLEINRHPVSFIQTSQNLNRTGFKQELINNLCKNGGKDLGKTKKLINTIKTMEIDTGEMIQGPEIKELMHILSIIPQSQNSYKPEINHKEKKITIKKKGYEYREFNGYLSAQMQKDAVMGIIKDTIMNIMLEDVGYDKELDDEGLRYLHCGVMKCWRSIMDTRSDNVPENPGDLMDVFDHSKWNETDDIDIDPLQLKYETTDIMRLYTKTLAMSLQELKSKFPLTYKLNKISHLKILLLDWTSMGMWEENPASDKLLIHQTPKPFDLEQLYMNRTRENKIHTFQIPSEDTMIVKDEPNINILLGAGYMDEAGALRKYKSTADAVTLGDRVIRNIHNMGVRPGIKKIITFRDVHNHTVKSPSSLKPYTVEDLLIKRGELSDCLCNDLPDIPMLNTQICYPTEFYRERKLNSSMKNDEVQDLSPWINVSTVNSKGVNPAMSTFSKDDDKILLAPSEPGAVVASTPHKKTSLFCGTDNQDFRDEILKYHGKEEMVRIIEKEINQTPERMSASLKIGEEYEKIIKKAFGTIPAYTAANPMVPPTVFLKFEKFCSMSAEVEYWEVKDVESLVLEIQKDLKTWKVIKCPWCLSSMPTAAYRIHYQKFHPDSISLLTTCDMIQSNKRAFVSMIMFLVLCLDTRMRNSAQEHINELKKELLRLKTEKEILDKAPGHHDLKKQLSEARALIGKLNDEAKEKDLEIRHQSDHTKNLTSKNKMLEEENIRLRKELNERNHKYQHGTLNGKKLKKKLASMTKRHLESIAEQKKYKIKLYAKDRKLVTQRMRIHRKNVWLNTVMKNHVAVKVEPTWVKTEIREDEVDPLAATQSEDEDDLLIKLQAQLEKVNEMHKMIPENW